MNRTLHSRRLQGFTLVELMIAMSIFTVVLMMLLSLSLAMGSATRFQDAKITSQDDARNAMMVMVPEIRQASRTSINWADLPGSTITYQVATDLDGNGFAVDVNTDLELGPAVTIGRDVGDTNGDGRGNDQLIRTSNGAITVLANGLRDDEDANGNGLLDGGEDLNGNGQLDQGILFAPLGQGLQITIQTQRAADPSGTTVEAVFSEIVIPRN